MRESRYVWGGRSFGWREALFFPDGFHVDLWTRYSRTAAAITRRLPKNGSVWSVLEVGSGGAGLAGFMRDGDFWRRVRLVLADYDVELLHGMRHGWATVADASQLPFPDRAFDAVLAIDLFEHLPAAVRVKAASELKRLARRLVVCHCPVEGPEEGFRGRWADERFGEEYRLRYQKAPPRWTSEHLAAGHPTPSELRALFPGCSLSGDQNCDVWLRYMITGEPSNGRLSRLLTGWRYRRRWFALDNRPPFRSALLVYEPPPFPASV